MQKKVNTDEQPPTTISIKTLKITKGSQADIADNEGEPQHHHDERIRQT